MPDGTLAATAAGTSQPDHAGEMLDLIGAARGAGLIAAMDLSDLEAQAGAAALIGGELPADALDAFADALAAGPAAEKALGVLDRLFRPGDLVELRALDPHRRGPAPSCFGCLGDAAGRSALSAFIREHIGRRNLYFGANPRKPGTGRAPSAQDVEKRRMVFLDLDLKDAPAEDPTWGRTVGALQGLGVALTVDTGNGVHVWFDVAECDAGATAGPLADALAAIGSDYVADAPRIARLPFTANIPSAKKREGEARPVLALPRAGSHAAERPAEPRSVESLCADLTDVAGRLGLPGKARSSKGEASAPDRAERGPRAAPSAAALRLAISLLPNDQGHFDERDEWIAVGSAIKGAAIAGGFEEDGREAFLEWCDRWTGAASPGAAETFWDTLHAPRAGWDSILADLSRANPAGAETLQRHIAQMDFEPVPDAEILMSERRDGTTAAGDAATMFAGFRLLPVTPAAPEHIPPRKWLYGLHLTAGSISMLVAPGGTGKSALVMAEAVAMATGRELLNGDESPRPLKVWYHNGEDGEDEQRRRLAAAMMHHGVTASDLGANLFLTSGRDIPLTLARVIDKAPALVPGVVDALCAHVEEQRIDVLILDPLGALHTLPENSNEAANLLMGGLRTIAHRTGAAIQLVHHTGKGASADMDAAGAGASRGASAFVDAARNVRQIRPMTTAEATKLKIPEADRWRHLRVGNGKANLAPRQGGGWLKLVSVALGNGADLWPNGDNVQTVETWAPPAAIGATRTDLTRVQEAIAQAGAPPRASSQSPDWVGYLAAGALGLNIGPHRGDRSPDEEQARRLVKDFIADWTAKGALEEFRAPDEQGHPRPCIRVGKDAGLLELHDDWGDESAE